MSVRSTIKVIDTIHRHVDFFKIGALNHMDPPEPINLVEAHREIMEALDELLASFVEQKRMKLPGTTYSPCYKLAT